METWVSGPGLAADHLRVTGETATAAEIAARAADGDGTAAASLGRYVSRLGRGLAHVVNMIDPQVIVLGGGLSQVGMLYDALPAAMAGYVLADDHAVDVRPPRWGDASGVRGAAWLWDA